VMITSFYDGSDLQKAGLAKGDVVTAVNGQPLHTVQDMLAFTPTLSAGTTLHLTARHGTETKDYEITLTR
jgi:S1-C subfamily serine protease